MYMGLMMLGRAKYTAEPRTLEVVYFFLQISNDGKLILIVYYENCLSDFLINLRATRVALLSVVYT